ncbi:MAG: endonuclease/exonuclease/phosphatase family protein [Candidatus Sungbacteria bacterium]|nr:endonuclease/exonuclease/phosphatase family protein [Candidatus Sungbacteria bacterium]
MKLISLNIWGGRAYDPLMDFIKKSAKDTDIFCFQEVFSSPAKVKVSRNTYVNILADLVVVLDGYNLFWGPKQDGFDNAGPVDFEVTEGSATFIKKYITAESYDNFFICGERNSASRDVSTKCYPFPASMLCTRINTGGKRYVIGNVYGFPYPGTKLDTPERLEQSRKIKKVLENDTGEKILCGDLNLMPGTESIKMLEGNMENLIKKYKVMTTRSRINPYFGTSEEQKFADYTFVSPGIRVKDFQVPDISVSDHLPMILSFE